MIRDVSLITSYHALGMGLLKEIQHFYTEYHMGAETGSSV